MIWRMVCIACLLCGCVANAETTQNTTASAVQAASETARLPDPPTLSWVLRDKTVLQQAQSGLVALPELQGKSILVYDKIHFFDGDRPRIELAVQNPRQPETLIFYTFENGKWSASAAEQVENIAPSLFALSQVDFAQAADMAKLWHEKAQMVQAVETTPYYVAFVYLPKQKKVFWHTATLEAVGKQYYLSFHANGDVWEFKRLSGKD